MEIVKLYLQANFIIFLTKSVETVKTTFIITLNYTYDQRNSVQLGHTTYSKYFYSS